MIHVARGEQEEAVTMLDSAMSLSQQISDYVGVTEALKQKAILSLERENWEAASDSCWPPSRVQATGERRVIFSCSSPSPFVI